MNPMIQLPESIMPEYREIEDIKACHPDIDADQTIFVLAMRLVREKNIGKFYRDLYYSSMGYSHE